MYVTVRLSIKCPLNNKCNISCMGNGYSCKGMRIHIVNATSDVSLNCISDGYWQVCDTARFVCVQVV